VSEVSAFLEERLSYAVEAGIDEERICLDPGFGFGKTPEQNLALLRRIDELVALGRPVMVGISRKWTLARIVLGADARVGTDAASVGAAVAAFDRGATLFRVHDVRSHVEALAVAAAVERGAV
jgi:dihydropteroate synthase